MEKNKTPSTSTPSPLILHIYSNLKMYLGIISNLKPLSRLTEMTKLSELTKLFELTELASTGTNLPVCPVSPRESQTEREAD